MSLHRFLKTTTQTAISRTAIAVAVTRGAIVIEDATDGMVDDVTDKSDVGKIEVRNVIVDDRAIEDAADGVVGDDERSTEDDADRIVEERDDTADDGVMEESTDWEAEDDTVKEDNNDLLPSKAALAVPEKVVTSKGTVNKGI